jgi:hypothetical protein
LIFFCLSFLKLIEIILAKLDCAYDISSCALVCRLWLDIINNHRAIQTSVTYNADYWPHHKFIRRFKSICIEESYIGESSDIDAEVLQQANEVIFFDCSFLNSETLKECVYACGDVTRLEIAYPSLSNGGDNLELVANAGRDSFDYSNQKIETLVLVFDFGNCNWRILDMFHNDSLKIENIEVRFETDEAGAEWYFPEPDTEEEWVNYYARNQRVDHPLLFSLEKNQDKLRELELLDRLLFELLEGLPRLKLKKFSIYINEEDEYLDDDTKKSTTKFIRSQPSITELTFLSGSINIVAIALNHLPLLTVLKLHCTLITEFNMVSENIHLLSTLNCLELQFSKKYQHRIASPDPDQCDITFISKLPSLEKFTCRFSDAVLLTLKPIANPMLLLKEFHVSQYNPKGVEIDEESMWNIFHRMPNLEQMTMHPMHRSLDDEKMTVSNLAILIDKNCRLNK